MSQISNSRWLICRICLKSENNKLYNIFEPLNDEEEFFELGTILQDKIELCGDVKLYQQHNLPHKICSRCLLLLRAAFKFRDLCQQSQNQLKQFISTIAKKEQTDEHLEINFDSDAEEQKAEAQEEVENVILSDNDYVIEESVVEYDTSEEATQNTLVKNNDDFMQTIPEVEEGAELDGYSIEEENSQYVVEVDSEDNENDMVNYKYETEDNSENKINEEEEKTERQGFIVQQIHEKKPAVKRKRKQMRDESVNGIYNCTYCDNAYKDRTKYINHIKIHAKDKPHECEICQKRFSTTPQLSRHMNSHTGNRPYKCKFCEARFGDPSTRIKHERIHTNERPYKCNQCDKAFAYSNVLKVHMMTHSGEKPHVCRLCSKTFSQLHHKNAHEKRHTNNVNMVMVNSSNDIEYYEEEEDDLKEYKIEEFI